MTDTTFFEQNDFKIIARYRRTGDRKELAYLESLNKLYDTGKSLIDMEYLQIVKIITSDKELNTQFNKYRYLLFCYKKGEIIGFSSYLAINNGLEVLMVHGNDETKQQFINAFNTTSNWYNINVKYDDRYLNKVLSKNEKQRFVFGDHYIKLLKLRFGDHNLSCKYLLDNLEYYQLFNQMNRAFTADIYQFSNDSTLAVSPNDLVWIVFDGDNPIGMFSFLIVEHVAYLGIYILPKFRGNNNSVRIYDLIIKTLSSINLNPDNTYKVPFLSHQVHAKNIASVKLAQKIFHEPIATIYHVQ